MFVQLFYAIQLIHSCIIIPMGTSLYIVSQLEYTRTYSCQHGFVSSVPPEVRQRHSAQSEQRTEPTVANNASAQKEQSGDQASTSGSVSIHSEYDVKLRRNVGLVSGASLIIGTMIGAVFWNPCYLIHF
jgi:hypothetical protein